VRRTVKQIRDAADEATEPSAESRSVSRTVVVVRLPSSPAALPPVTRVRSTLITSSLRALDERNLLERYFSLLAKEHAGEIRGAIAGVWLPVDVAVAHYQACDALGMTTSEQLEMGRRVGGKIQGTLLGTLVTVAKQAGVSPWTFLERFDRFYERLTIGGGIAVSRLADKDALIVIYKVPLFETTYFATAWRGVIQGICDLFCTKAYVKPGRLTGERMTYTISWA
jgi:hypothetical protein